MVARIDFVQHWIGLSTDIKPSPEAHQIGSTFHEHDTGRQWIWTGEAWTEDLRLFYAISSSV